MLFSNSKIQSSSRSDIDAIARYLQPEFDIENPEPLTPRLVAPLSSQPASQPAPQPAPQLRSPRETALIYQHEQSASSLSDFKPLH